MATYLQLAALKTNADFVARVEIGVAKFAEYKLDENPAAQGHALSVKWAQNALANPASVAAGLLPAVVLDGNIAAKAATPADLTDAEVQSAVEVAINRVLNS
jgi:hypothetical protein